MKPTDIWISDDREKIAVLIKPSKSVIEQIQKLVKTEDRNSVSKQSEVKKSASIKDASEWVLKITILLQL